MEQAQERRTIQSHQCDTNSHPGGREFHLVPPQPLHKAAQPKTREDRKEELGAGVPGTDRPPQDQTKPSQEQQPHDDAEADEPAPDPLQALANSTDPETDPEEE